MGGACVGISQCPEKRGLLSVSSGTFMGQVTGRQSWRGGDGMSMFGGRLLAGAAIDCQAFDCSHGCPLCAVRQTLQVGTNCYQRCRARQLPKWVPSASFGASRRLAVEPEHTWSLLGAFPINLYHGRKGSSVRGQKGIWRITTRCFDIDSTSMCLPGPAVETWFGGRNSPC